MGIFDYQSGNSEGILIHVLGMNPIPMTYFFTLKAQAMLSKEHYDFSQI